METKANYAVVGLFTVIVVLLSFGFVYWMSEYKTDGQMVVLKLKIPGSANGLSVGSAVRFNGIPVGTVRALNFDIKDPEHSIALTEIRADAPVYEDTSAVLEMQGLTGTAYIELSGGTITKTPILKAALESGTEAELNARQSGVTNLVATASEIMAQTKDTLGDLSGFIEDNRAPLSRTIANAEAFSEALKANADGIDEFLKSVSELSTTITSVSGRLDSTLASVEDLVKAVDAKKVDAILTNAETISKDLAGATGQAEETMAELRATIKRFDDFGKSADESLKKVDQLIAAIDPATVGQSVEDAKTAIADAKAAASSIRELADGVNKRKDDIDRIVTNVADMSEKLNAASNRVDGVLAKIDSFLGSADGSSVMADLKTTLESFRKMADNLNARIGPIADNLQRFTGSGLQDIKGLIADTRRTVQTLGQAVEKLDRDPQRLIFGGEDVKVYDGRVRR